MTTPYINRAAGAGPSNPGGGTGVQLITQTPSNAGQVLLFNTTVFIKTVGSSAGGVEMLPVDATGQHVTESLLDKNNRIRIIFDAKQPSPPITNQPPDSWALPNFALLADSNLMLNSNYFRFKRLLSDGVTDDPASSLALVIMTERLNNFNNVTQQPYSTFDAVQKEIFCNVVNAVTLTRVDLETSTNYALEVSPELLFNWYTP